MRVCDRRFKPIRLVLTLLVASLCLFWSFPHAARSVQSESTEEAPQPNELSPPIGASETNLSELSDPVSPAQPTSPATVPPGYVTNEEVKEALRKEAFTYSPGGMLDPFVSFITPVQVAPPVSHATDEDVELPPEPQKPLTPLQRMPVAEIERGLRAISWGDLGRKAVIEDAAGKGYIVGVGTPAGDKNGIVTAIFNDRLVIQQEIWDRKLKKMVPQNSVVKLYKEEKKQ